MGHNHRAKLRALEQPEFFQDLKVFSDGRFCHAELRAQITHTDALLAIQERHYLKASLIGKSGHLIRWRRVF